MISLLLALFTLSGPVSAHAAIEEVVAPNLYLLGGAVSSNRHHFQVAMACTAGVDESHQDISHCKEVRFIAFTQARRAYFIGIPYRIANLDGAKSVAISLYNLNEAEKTRRAVIGMFLFCATFGGGIMISVAHQTLFPAVHIMVAFFGKLITGMIVGKSDREQIDNFFGGYGTVFTHPGEVFSGGQTLKFVKVTLEQDGWRHLENPAKLHRAGFKRLLKHIEPDALPFLDNN